MIIEGSRWTTSIAKGAPVFNQMHLSLERDFEMAVIIFYFTASTKWYKETEEDDKTTITSPHTPSVIISQPMPGAMEAANKSKLLRTPKNRM